MVPCLRPSSNWTSSHLLVNPAATVEPQPVRSSGGTFSVEPYKSLGAGTQVGSTTIVVLDSSLPQKSFNAVINCNP